MISGSRKAREEKEALHGCRRTSTCTTGLSALPLLLPVLKIRVDTHGNYVHDTLMNTFPPQNKVSLCTPGTCS